MLYSAVCLMDSLLRYPSGQSYDQELINQISEERIRDVAHEAGNYIDVLVAQCLPHCKSAKRKFISDDPLISEIRERIVSIYEELKKIRDNRMTTSPTVNSTFSGPSRRTSNTEGKLVGLENDLVMMLDSLTRQTSQLKILSIIGMGGIGKTTFSKKLYDNPLVVHHFYIRMWVTVSQHYQEQRRTKRTSLQDFKGQEYLVVLDDMWDTKAWDELKRIFPDDKNGSRIMLTSRLKHVVVHASQDTPPHYLRCLSVDESWELLSSKIFVDESCPMELVAIGKQIAYKCRGLPLAIVVVGGLLSKMNKKLDVWEEVAQSVGSLLMEEAEYCQSILALSYNHLPDYLKACFLYMGVFPEDYEISIKKLICLRIAEGFIRPSSLKSLEEVAEDYIEDLTTRSLILVKRTSSDGRIKTCCIHDLMRELCLRESQKQNFFHVINSCEQHPLMDLRGNLLPNPDTRQISPNYLYNVRRLSFHSSIRKYIQHRTSLRSTGSFMCFEKLSLSDPQSCLGINFRLLKVLDIMNIHLSVIPEDIQNLTLLKFLALTVDDSFDIAYVIKFCRLQTLILDCGWDGHLLAIFWNMLELRHFHLKRSFLSYSPNSFGSVKSHLPGSITSQPPSTLALQLLDARWPIRVLNNLKSLSAIRPINCTQRVFLSMPHLKKLGVHETEEDYQFHGWFKVLVHLGELETLKYVFSNPFVSSVLKPDRLPSWDCFPPKLVKLTLSGTAFPWEDMFKLSMLPKLEVLKLRNYAFSGALWKSRQGGFACLKFLLIGSTNLEIWEADGTHFPNLRCLVLRHCRSLKKIPYGIGEAPLLENIELHCCKDSVAMSARQLLEEQQSLGNDGLTIRITEG